MIEKSAIVQLDCTPCISYYGIFSFPGHYRCNLRPRCAFILSIITCNMMKRQQSVVLSLFNAER